MAPNAFHQNPAIPPPSAELAESQEAAKVMIRSIAKGGVATPFPYKLHIMLEAMDVQAAKGDIMGKSIVGWQPHGRAFKVHIVELFVEQIMPHFFKQSKYASFQRQLNLYGFNRITACGPDKGAVYHPCFVRYQPHLLQGMVRKRIKGTKIRKAVNPDHQPNFYANEELRAVAVVGAAVDAAFHESSDATNEDNNHTKEFPISSHYNLQNKDTISDLQLIIDEDDNTKEFPLSVHNYNIQNNDHDCGVSQPLHGFR